MPQPRQTNQPPINLGHQTTAQLHGRPTLTPGVEATINLPEARTNKRLRFIRQQDTGTYTFADTDGRFRTVTEDRIITIHRDRKLR